MRRRSARRAGPIERAPDQDDGRAAQHPAQVCEVGDAGLRTLAPRLRKAGARLGREVNPVTMTVAEFVKNRKNNAFLVDVLAKEKLFVKGGPDELDRLG